MNRNRTTLILAVIILLAGATVGTTLGLLSARAAGGDTWPTICAVEDNVTTCVIVTITPVVWDAETAAAVATWEAGRRASAPAP